MAEEPKSIHITRLYVEQEISAIRSHLKATPLVEKQQGGIKISRLLEFLLQNPELATQQDISALRDLLTRAGQNLRIGCFTDARNHVNEAFLLIRDESVARIRGRRRAKALPR